nr:ribonuclease H-like domain-containing protein [Tanacetum cinerariifolium]
MVAYLSKSDASQGFNQIVDFLNGISIKYALTVNPNIYVSYIKQFWNIVVVKQVNDVTRLQVLVDKKKVVITEAAIREVLHLDDVEGVDCLPNEEIFIELARMGYEKPSTKLTFYKAFFSSQGNHKQYASLPHANPQKHMVPAAVLTQSKPVSITAVRPVSADVPNIKAPVVSAAQGMQEKWGNPQYALTYKGVIDSGCSRHMTGNMSYLSDFEELNGGYVAFRGHPKG